MNSFLQNLKEGLQGREKFLEEKFSSLIGKKKDEKSFTAQYDKLQEDLKAFQKRISELEVKGEDFDEKFTRKIKDDHQYLDLKIETWAKSWTDEEVN
jgi:predicted  nucleic acid-binding Zn-ribbon protein